jgi:ArsR family transcriptional regulator
MKILCSAGIVTGRQEGKWTHYSISQTGCARAKELLTRLTMSGGAADRSPDFSAPAY